MRNVATGVEQQLRCKQNQCKLHVSASPHAISGGPVSVVAFRNRPRNTRISRGLRASRDKAGTRNAYCIPKSPGTNIVWFLDLSENH